jgi:hypothetical protein
LAHACSENGEGVAEEVGRGRRTREAGQRVCVPGWRASTRLHCPWNLWPCIPCVLTLPPLIMIVMVCGWPRTRTQAARAQATAGRSKPTGPCLWSPRWLGSENTTTRTTPHAAYAWTVGGAPRAMQDDPLPTAWGVGRDNPGGGRRCAAGSRPR